MAVYHLLYRTNVAGRVPTAVNMPPGRLGLNLVDERIYFTNEAGNVVEPQPRPHTHTVNDITNLASTYLPLTGGSMNGGPIVLGTSSVGSVYGTTTGVTRSAYNILPSGGRYSANGSVTGAMQILFPPEAQTSTTGFICALEIDVFQDSGARTPTKMRIEGSFATGSWSNTTVLTLTGDSVQNMAVRFGVLPGNAPAIWIGEVGYAWTTPSVTLTSVLIKGTTPQASNAVYGVGWNIAPVTALGTVQQTSTDNLPLSKQTAAAAQLLPTVAHDLNSYSTQSEWVQTSQAGADAGANYPIALPGFLEIVANSGTSVLQRFSTFTTAQTTRRMFFRTKGTGSWTNWVETPTNYGSLAYLGAVPDASDLNTFLDRGIWQVANSTTASGGTNFPAPYSGYLIVLSTAVQGSGATITSGVTQLYYAANTNVSYTRSLVNGTWTDWGGNSAATVLTTQNLNDVVGAGTYYMNSDATATAILNYPVELAGVLEVVRAPSGNMQVMQRYTTRNATNTRIFVRNRFSTSLTWFPWLEITSLIPQSSTVDTTAGRGMIVGAFGLGAWAPNLNTYGFASDFNTIDTRTCHVTVDQNMTNGPLGTGSAAYTALLRVQRRQFIAGTAVTQEVFMQDGSIWTRVGTGEIGSTTWTAWAKTLTTANNQVAFNHVFLTANTDANTLIADQTYYTWTASSVTNSGTNWPSPAGSGYLRVYWAAASFIVQEVCFVSSGSKPRMYSRYGNSSTGVWENWKSISSHSSPAFLPTTDCGDIYVDKIGWYSWNGVSYVPNGPMAPVRTDDTNTLNLNSIPANSYTRTTSTTPVTVTVPLNVGAASFEYHFRQGAAGVITFAPATGVTINPPFGGSLVTAGLGATVTLKCIAANVYDLLGATGA